MKYLHKKTIGVPLYRGNLMIILTNDKKHLQKYLPEFRNIGIYAHTWCCNINKIESFVIVLNFDNSFRKIHNGSIAHEALHAANFIAKDRGIESDLENDEPIAYLTEWIVDEIYEFVNEHGMRPI